ncbi:MAG TPA: hypothetical protein VKU60_17605, partial [Chloroflexota bacterium]|nr:hypothetical protein [Chloroflexota bacterium]
MGADKTISALLRGELFDLGRFPSLTLLVVAGVLVCIWRWRDERYRIPIVLGGVWLALYFGRPTWGVLINLLPFSRELAFHRLISGVHLAAIPLMAIALAAPWPFLVRHGWRYVASGIAAVALVLTPVIRERMAYYAGNVRLMDTTSAAVSAEQTSLNALILTLRQLPPGRVYAGRAPNWAKTYRVGDLPVSVLLQSAGFDMLTWLLYHSEALNGDVQTLFDESRLQDYEVYDVRYFVAPTDHPVPSFLQLIGTFGRHRLYQALTSGYFELGASNQAFVGNKTGWYPAAAAWLGSNEPAGKEFSSVFFGSAPAGTDARPLAEAYKAVVSPPSPADYGQVTSEVVGTGSYEAQLDAVRPATLVLKESFVPGWRAWIDGQPAATRMVMPSYVAIDVASGPHSVRFQYDSGMLRHVLLVIGLLALAGIGFASKRLSALFRSPVANEVVAAGSFNKTTFEEDEILRRTLGALGQFGRPWTARVTNGPLWSAVSRRIVSLRARPLVSTFVGDLPFLLGVG